MGTRPGAAAGRGISGRLGTRAGPRWLGSPPPPGTTACGQAGLLARLGACGTLLKMSSHRAGSCQQCQEKQDGVSYGGNRQLRGKTHGQEAPAWSP